MKKLIFLFCLTPILLFASSLRLYNNSPYDLKAVIRGFTGTVLGQVDVASGQTLTWLDRTDWEKDQRLRPMNREETGFAQTPYTVTWFLEDGDRYGFSGPSSSGGMVTPQTGQQPFGGWINEDKEEEE